MKSQQRRGPDGDREFQYALRRHEHCAQAQQDTVQGAQSRCLLSRSIQDQQLMLQKKRFGNDCAGTAGSRGSDRRDDQMSHQDEPIPHTANDDRAGRKLQDYEPVADCVRISIRHGHDGSCLSGNSRLRATRQHRSVVGDKDPPSHAKSSRTWKLAASSRRHG